MAYVNRGRGNWRGSGDLPLRSRGPGGYGYRRGNYMAARREHGVVTPYTDVGDLLESISREDCSSTDQQELSITGTQLLASFNWMSDIGANPCIAVPGMPPKWAPLNESRELEEDKGIFYRDQNAAHFPGHPLEPTVEAVQLLHPSYPGDAPAGGYELFGCGSTLGNLYRFVSNNGNDAKQFRALVEVIGGTVHLIRREKSPLETIDDVKGFGHTFPDAYTTMHKALSDASTHQRVIGYRFAGINCLVRFEGDGYLPEAEDPYEHALSETLDSRPTQRVAEGSTADRGSSVGSSSSQDSLEDAFAGLSVSPPTTSQAPLRVESRGVLVPQNAIFDLKTRSEWHKANLGKVLRVEMPRLWIRQIPNLVLAFHEKGCGIFNDIRVRNIQKDLDEWEKENKSNIRRFGTLLQRVVCAARARSDGKMEVIFNGGDRLDFRKQKPDVAPALSDAARIKWEKWLRGGRYSHSKGEEEHFEGSEDESSEGDGNGNGEEDEPDYTVCDRECGYCGRCK
ncbi:hypothetical protein B0I35DRAFT_440231 [Stachybotrys elegans]|uniref:Geranylgeranyl pyrophosphate synthetase n=1 Tax=Stachybotrys elegans TaxID=80388 RepID=A0A8K0SM99_9HYPO|nr:hypothetical protein B0I35DRAFT_440231 [Stachybotrys elegans]